MEKWSLNTESQNKKNRQMQAKDFRIGNLVKHDNRIFAIDTITNEFLTLDTIEFVVLIDWNNIEPIKLTVEWLDRFGFEKCVTKISELKAVDYVIVVDDLEIYADLDDDENINCVCVSYLDKEINYVHQLQNLYFELTGKELY